jgi:hypothetical protein
VWEEFQELGGCEGFGPALLEGFLVGELDLVAELG